MKLFRRISALALAVAMICLLSASAFALQYHDTADDYPDEIEVYVFAETDQTSTTGDLYISSYDTIGNYIKIDQSFIYYPYWLDPQTISVNNCVERWDVPYAAATFNGLSAAAQPFDAMLKAYYTFEATFFSSQGEQSYNGTSGWLYS